MIKRLISAAIGIGAIGAGLLARRKLPYIGIPILIISLAVGGFFLFRSTTEEPFALAFAGGDGSSGDPYQISNCTELQDMESDLDAFYVLINDIDCSDTVNWDSGAGFDPIGNLAGGDPGQFEGSLDGAGFTISDLFINRAERAAMFSFFTDGTITDLVLENFDITSSNSTAQGGTLIARMGGGTIARVGARGGSVTTNAGDTGGLIGFVNSGTVTDAFQVGVSVTGASDTGGLIGDLRATLTNGYSTGAVNTGGGLIGAVNTGGSANDSFWDTETSGRATSAGGTGKTTAEMQDIDTYTTGGPTWDMVLESNHDGEFATAVWAIDDGVDYPKLWFEVEAAVEEVLLTPSDDVMFIGI